MKKKKVPIRQLEHEETPRQGMTFPLVVVCENFGDPRNVGAAFRLADALGVVKLYLTGSTPVPPNRKLSRSARSAEQVVPFEYVQDPQGVLRRLKGEGYMLAGLELTTGSEDIRQVDFRGIKPLALVAGAERSGIEKSSLELLDRAVQIPMFGRNSSLNVAMALAIGLYEVVRQWTDHES